jgi:hypothetical protein
MCHHYTKRRRLSVLFLFAVLILIFNRTAKAEKGEISGFSCFVSVYGGSCEPGFPNVLAGSSIQCFMYSTVDQELLPLKHGWPEGYTLEASLDPHLEAELETTPSSFNITPGLIEKLMPVPYWDYDNKIYNDYLLKGELARVNKRELNRKCFMLSIPPDLAGHTIAIRCRYNKNGITAVSNVSDRYRIIAPCSTIDSARIVGSFIHAAREMEEYERGVFLADSILSRGWTDASAWFEATVCASRSNQYAKELVYLDKLYNDFGVLEAGFGTSKPPKLDIGGPRNGERTRRYLEHRNYLLRVIAEQEGRPADSLKSPKNRNDAR